MSLYAWHNGAIVSGCLLDNDRWVEVRKLALASALQLPCRCIGHCAVRRWGRGQSRLTRYFRHRQDESCAASRQRAQFGESFNHLALKDLAMKVAARLGCGVAIEKGEDGWRADVLVTSPKTGNRACLEIQLSPEPPEAIEARTLARANTGVRTIWFFGSKAMFDLLPTSLRNSPCLSLGDGDLESMASSLERQLTLYLKGRLAYDSFDDLSETPVELLDVEIPCQKCGQRYDALIGAVLRFEERRGDMPPIFISVRSDRWFPYLAREIGLKRPFDLCPHCKADPPQIKITKEQATTAPRSPRRHVCDGTVYLMTKCGINPRPHWREKPHPGRSPKRMSKRDWKQLTDRLLAGHHRQIREAAEQARRAQHEKSRQEEAQRGERRNQVNQALWRILGNIAPEESASFRESNWRRTILPRYGASPESIIENLESWDFDRLKRELDDIIDMVAGESITAEHLGLPVGPVYRERIDARERKYRQKRSIRLIAVLAVLTCIDDAWLNEPWTDLDGAVPAALAQESDDACARVIAAARKENGRRAEKVERDRAAEEYRARLRDDARRIFVDEERAALWLRGTNHRLDRKRPMEYCEDAATYARCIEALAEQSPNRRR